MSSLKSASKKEINALNTETNAGHFCVLCSSDDHMANDSPYTRKSHAHNVEALLPNLMYDLRMLNIIHNSGYINFILLTFLL